MTTFVHVHGSGRFDRRVILQDRETDAWASIPKCRLITRTEQGNDNPARDKSFQHPGWKWWQSPKDNGHDDCAFQYDASYFDLDHVHTEELSPLTWVRSPQYGGKRAATVKAVVARLIVRSTGKPVWLLLSHDPLDNTPARARAWRDCQRGKRRIIRRIRKQDGRGVKILVVADWNKNFRRPSERAAIRLAIAVPCRLRQAWRGHVPKHGGTHGQQIIDGDVTNLGIKRCWLLPDTAASDHRPYATELLAP